MATGRARARTRFPMSLNTCAALTRKHGAMRSWCPLRATSGARDQTKRLGRPGSLLPGIGRHRRITARRVDGRKMPRAAVGWNVVVILPPAGEHRAGRVQVREPVLRRALTPVAPVAGFNVAVVHRLALAAEVQPDPVPAGPVVERFRGAAVRQHVADEVHRPAFVRSGDEWLHLANGSALAPLRPPPLEREPLFRVQPVDELVIEAPALSPKQRTEPLVAPTDPHRGPLSRPRSASRLGRTVRYRTLERFAPTASYALLSLGRYESLSPTPPRSAPAWASPSSSERLRQEALVFSRARPGA